MLVLFVNILTLFQNYLLTLILLFTSKLMSIKGGVIYGKRRGHLRYDEGAAKVLCPWAQDILESSLEITVFFLSCTITQVIVFFFFAISENYFQLPENNFCMFLASVFKY